MNSLSTIVDNKKVDILYFNKKFFIKIYQISQNDNAQDFVVVFVIICIKYIFTRSSKLFTEGYIGVLY